MTQASILTIDSQTLVKAWQDTLPTLLKSSDECTIQADAKFPDTLLIHIDNAGRSQYSVDFRVQYVDEREVRVDVIDIEKDDVSTNIQNDAIQKIIEDYMRHIHECAQQLKGLTKA